MPSQREPFHIVVGEWNPGQVLGYLFPEGGANSIGKNERWSYLDRETDLKVIDILVVERSAWVSSFDLVKYKWEMIQVDRGIPDGHDVEHDPTRDGKRYTWRALQVTLNQYETLFDFEIFEPA